MEPTSLVSPALADEVFTTGATCMVARRKQSISSKAMTVSAEPVISDPVGFQLLADSHEMINWSRSILSRKEPAHGKDHHHWC